MKSVGDFYVSIIPKLDQIALNTGISAANASLEMFSKAWGLGKGFFGAINETAQEMAEIVRISKELKEPVETVQLLGIMFKNVGLSANEAYGTIESLQDSWRALTVWGEANYGKLAMNNMLGIRSGDTLKDLLKISEVLKGMSAAQQSEALAAMNLSPQLRRLLNDPNEFKRFMAEARPFVIGQKQMEGTLDYDKQVKRFDNIRTKFEAELVTNSIPAITDLIEKLNNLMTKKEFIQSANNLSNAMVLFVDTFSGIAGFFIERVGGMFSGNVQNTFLGNLVSLSLGLSKAIGEALRSEDKISEQTVNVLLKVSDNLEATIEGVSKNINATINREANMKKIENKNSGGIK
jgi:hypothetical protein